MQLWKVNAIIQHDIRVKHGVLHGVCARVCVLFFSRPFLIAEEASKISGGEAKPVGALTGYTTVRPVIIRSISRLIAVCCFFLFLFFIPPVAVRISDFAPYTKVYGGAINR